jgi:hypothetical protein
VITLVMLLLQPDNSYSPSTHAAWLAVQHAHDRGSMPASWWWHRLQSAREAVADVHYSVAPLPDWQKQLYGTFLDFAPIILPLILLLGMTFAFRAWQRHRVARSMTWSLATFAVLFLGVGLAQPDQRPLAIIKVPGTLVRQGNGLSYPVQTRQGMLLELAAGVEAEYLGQRDNGWVQLRLRDGIQGWVPLDGVYLVRVEP